MATPDGNEIKGWEEDDWGNTVPADLALRDVNVDDYQGIVLPGGQINPDLLRADKNAVEFVRSFWNSGKAIGAICNAPWLLAEADIVKGRKVTSFNSIEKDIRCLLYTSPSPRDS